MQQQSPCLILTTVCFSVSRIPSWLRINIRGQTIEKNVCRISVANLKLTLDCLNTFTLPIQRRGCIAFMKKSCTQQQCARVQLLVFGILFAYKAAHKAITKRKSARVLVQTHARARERNFPWKKGHYNRALKRATKSRVRVLLSERAKRARTPTSAKICFSGPWFSGL